MTESRCGLICSTCTYKHSHGCGGCIETMGNPFYGECHIAVCCQNKGYKHCGECDVIPCQELYAYSYLDPEHGDKPQGKRVANCRNWAAALGKQKWERVLLTSAGFKTPDGEINSNIRSIFLELLGKPAEETKALFIPTAAVSDAAKRYAAMCKEELLGVGIMEEFITEHDIDGTLTETEAMSFDVIYLPGGSTSHLLERIRETGFDSIIKRMVYANKVYVGVSAGSIIATPNIDKADVLNPDTQTAGLALVHAYIDVHCTELTSRHTDLPLPHIRLTDRQALWVTYAGFTVIEG